MREFEAEKLNILCGVNGRNRTVPEKKVTGGLEAKEWVCSGCTCSLQVARLHEARLGWRILS